MARLLPPAPIARPHETRTQRLTRPAFALSNAAFCAALLPVALSARARWTAQPAPPSAAPIIYYCFHRYAWVSYFIFSALPKELRPTAIAHDGLASRLNHSAGAWLGYPTFVFSRRASTSPREQIIAHAQRTGCHLMLLPDSGGPYGQLKPGILEIAQRLGAWLQPFAVPSTPALTVGASQRHVVPLPFSRLEVHLGPMLPPTSSLADLQQALETLETS